MSNIRIAGVDVGGSLVKACWGNGAGPVFASTADIPLEELRQKLIDAGITRLHLVGIGYVTPVVKGFEVRRQSDVLDAEISFQAAGARQLLNELDPKESNEDFLLVSVGTGVSFTFVSRDQYWRFPIGSARGGRTLSQRAMLMGVPDLRAFAELAGHGNHLDSLVKDEHPELAGSPIGEFVLAFMGKARSDSRREDLAASEVHDVAASIASHIVMISMTRDAKPFDKVFFIGTTVGRLPKLREYLAEWTLKIGKRPLFHENGEYALALGALFWNKF